MHQQPCLTTEAELCNLKLDDFLKTSDIFDKKNIFARYLIVSERLEEYKALQKDFTLDIFEPMSSEEAKNHPSFGNKTRIVDLMAEKELFYENTVLAKLSKYNKDGQSEIIDITPKNIDKIKTYCTEDYPPEFNNNKILDDFIRNALGLNTKDKININIDKIEEYKENGDIDQLTAICLWAAINNKKPIINQCTLIKMNALFYLSKEKQTIRLAKNISDYENTDGTLIELWQIVLKSKCARSIRLIKGHTIGEFKQKFPIKKTSDRIKENLKAIDRYAQVEINEDIWLEMTRTLDKLASIKINLNMEPNLKRKIYLMLLKGELLSPEKIQDLISKINKKPAEDINQNPDAELLCSDEKNIHHLSNFLFEGDLFNIFEIWVIIYELGRNEMYVDLQNFLSIIEEKHPELMGPAYIEINKCYNDEKFLEQCKGIKGLDKNIICRSNIENFFTFCSLKRMQKRPGKIKKIFKSFSSFSVKVHQAKKTLDLCYKDKSSMSELFERKNIPSFVFLIRKFQGKFIELLKLKKFSLIKDEKLVIESLSKDEKKFLLNLLCELKYTYIANLQGKYNPNICISTLACEYVYNRNFLSGKDTIIRIFEEIFDLKDTKDLNLQGKIERIRNFCTSIDLKDNDKDATEIFFELIPQDSKEMKDCKSPQKQKDSGAQSTERKNNTF